MRTLFLTLITCLFVLPAHAKYSGGTGEPNDPYQIATAADLIGLGETPEDYGKHFLLTADIDLDPNLPGRKVFDKAVIAPDTDAAKGYYQGTRFTGVFDGNSHTISHVTIQGVEYLGLFGYIASPAEITDLGVVHVKIVGSGGCVGGLVGSNGFSTSIDGGAVTRCYSTGMVSGTNSVGGLVGDMYNGRIGECCSTCTVSGDDFVGGLVGCNWGDCGMGGCGGGDVEECYSTGPVTGRSSVGGLIGSNTGPVTHCYSTGVVSGTSSAGGLVGYGVREDVIASFWNTETSGQATSAGGTSKTTTEMHDPNTFRAAGWDFVGQADGPHDIWAEPEGGGYPVLWWQLSPLPTLPGFSGGTGEPNDPYIISRPEELNSIGHNPRLMTCHFKLVSDLDLTGLSFYSIADSAYYPYSGVFDGNHHTISHLMIEGAGVRGPFGLLGLLGSEGEVKDLSLLDVNIVGSGGHVGGLVGLNGGAVARCYSTGKVNGTYHVGGLVGYNYGTVTHCYSTGAVSGSSYVGGLVGYNDCGTLTNCYSTGAISGTGDHVGGLVGYTYGGIATSSFWDIQTSGQTTSAGGTGKTTAEMQTAKMFLDAGWDFVGETANGTEDLWWILEGKDYPRLWWEAAEQ